jgi:hypothetical protein
VEEFEDRYQIGNQNMYIEEEQTTQWPNRKKYNDLQTPRVNSCDVQKVSSVFGKPKYAMDIQVVWMSLMKETIVWVILMHCLLYICILPYQ